MIDIGDFFSLSEGSGYLGILIVSFITSIILFIPVPYLPVLIAATFDNRLDPNIIALISAIGITTGRTLIFLASYYGRRILSDKTKERMLPLQRLLMRYGWIGAFISAITPFPPDDMVIILLGIAKYNPWKFIMANFFGKIMANMGVVWGVVFLGKPLVEQLVVESVEPTYIIIVTVISIIVVGVTLYLFLKINWGKIIGKWFPWTLTDNSNGDPL